jgi:nucleoside phosphorylase
LPATIEKAAQAMSPLARAARISHRRRAAVAAEQQDCYATTSYFFYNPIGDVCQAEGKMPPSPSAITSEDLNCNLLLFFATSTEKKELKTAAQEMGFVFERKRHPQLGEYFLLGTIGDFRVVAVETEMGPLGFEGSASKGIYFKQASGATAIVQLGMAFGVDPTRQRHGDILVSSSIIPYDRRKILAEGNGYRIDYSPAVRQNARPSMVELFARESQQADLAFGVHVGAVLSGGAAVFSRKFRDELVAAVPQTGEPIVGGEMEGVGLASVSAPEDPAWVLVKGISDFADEDRDAVINSTRPLACRNAARFVLAALVKAKQI